MASPHPATESSLTELARGKLVRILGPVHGERVFRQTLAKLGQSSLQTPEDLHAFADCLSQNGGLEAAIGGLLRVAAMVRGASGARSKPG